MNLLNTFSMTLWLALAANSTASAANEINFYIVAHPDDWQLFMNPAAYNVKESSSPSGARTRFNNHRDSDSLLLIFVSQNVSA